MDFKLDQAISILERTPRVLSDLLDDLAADWINVNEGPDTWNARQILLHLVNGERTDWIPRARIILRQAASRRFDPFDRVAGFDSTQPIPALLGEFDQLRAESIATLRGWNLKEKDLALTAEHPELGEVTMRQLLATWVVHDLSHLSQITRVMARAYTGSVGPWREYFSLMRSTDRST
jgi:hypothetical protein